MCIRDRRKAYDFRRCRAPVPDGMTAAAGHEQGFMLTDRFFPVSYTHLDVYKRQGQDVVDSIGQGDTISSITIEDGADDRFTEQADRIAAWNKALDK